MRSTGGFSLVETLAAAVLLAVGLASLAAAGRAALVLAEFGGRSAWATELAASRLDVLTSTCSGLTVAMVPGIREVWSVGAGTPLETASVTVTWASSGRRYSAIYTGLREPCDSTAH